MLTMFEEGGFPMWFLLAFGLATLFLAAFWARTPENGPPRPLQPLAAATLFTTLTATCADVAAVGHHAPEYLQAHPEKTLPEILLQGMAESMSPGILGFTVLSLAALLGAVARWREPSSRAN